MTTKIQTIQDLEEYYYVRPMQDNNLLGEIAKSSGQILSTTTGVYNAVYGAYAWAQLNMEANAFGVLPKFVWNRTGWRIITGRGSSSVTGGIAENGSLPSAIYPDVGTVSTKPKTVVHRFTTSEMVQWLTAVSEDDAYLGAEQAKVWFAGEHREHLNKMLLTDVDTLASNNMESLDRVCSNNSEAGDATISLDTGDADIYSLDRDSVTTYDSNVSHNSGTDRSLTDAIFRDFLFSSVKQNGGQTTIILTGYDTFSKLSSLYADQVRYNPMGEGTYQGSVNGIQTAEGLQGGVTLSTLYGIPVVISKNTAQDTISRIYLLDTSDPEGFGQPRLGVAVAKPTQYFEATDPFVNDKFAVDGAYRTLGELICTFFKAQGKIRDLQT